MKYKSFSILFLAVCASLGHITFSSTENTSESPATSWWMQNMPEAAIINEMNAIQSDIYELSYSEHRFADLESTFLESRQLLGKNREELEAYIAKIEEMQENIESNIEESIEGKQQLEQSIATIEKEIILIKERQVETKKYIRNILVDNYKATTETETDISLYGTLFQKTFWSYLSERDTLDRLQDSASQLLERQRAIEEELSELSKSLGIKIRAKKQILNRLENYQEELSDTEEIKKEVLSQTIKEQSLQRKIEKVTIKKQTLAVKIEEKFAEYEKSLQSKVAQYKCETKVSTVCVWLRWYIQAEKDLLTNKIINDIWDWPTPPLRKDFDTIFVIRNISQP
jgi:hypothetical protein